ncbi:MAG: metallophosphoesterase [Myxococcales bacterium]|nr:metallophosphoesterase [Myxococcales bacterium]
MGQPRRPRLWLVAALLGLGSVVAGLALWLSFDLRSARWAVAPVPVPREDGRPRVVRGPYLQTLTPKSVLVRWRTDLPVEGRVAFATVANPTKRVVRESAATREHELLLGPLAPGTAYAYDLVGPDDAPLAGGPSVTFTSPPGPASQAPVRVWALGDAGTASEGARAVRDAYLRHAKGRLPDVWLMLGDNAYTRGTDLEYQAAVFETYADILARVSLWPTRGNHDQGEGLAAPYFQVFSLPTRGEAGGLASDTEAYYAFEHGNTHFVCLDSYGSDRGPEGPMVSWLRRDLATRDARWTVVFFHHPPYSRGTHDSDRERAMIEMRKNVLPVLEEAGVDLVLTGHSHNYERSGLLAGHYGARASFEAHHKLASGGPGVVFEKRVGPRGGTVYVVAGASGNVGRRFAGLDHPAMDVSSATLGSVVLEISDEAIELLYLDANATVFDRFTLRKLAAPQGRRGG